MGTTSIFKTFFKESLWVVDYVPVFCSGNHHRLQTVAGSDGSLIIRWSGFPSDCGMQNILTITFSVS